MIILKETKKTKFILRQIAKETIPVSKYVNDSILLMVLPSCCSQLYNEAYLVLEAAANGNITQDMIRQMLSCAIKWAKYHPLKDARILRQIIANYYTAARNKGTILSNLNENVKQNIEDVQKKICEIDPSHCTYHIGLGQYAYDVLDHWGQLWDWAPAYDLLSDCVSCENQQNDFLPLEAINYVKGIELAYLNSLLNEGCLGEL